MFIGQKYVDKKEVLNKVIARINKGLCTIESNNSNVAEVCFIELFEDLVEAKISILEALKKSPLAEDFNPDVYTEDANACQLVYGDTEVEYHLRLERNDKVRGMDFLLFEGVLNPEDDETFKTEIELLAEQIAKECGDSYQFIKRKISYIKLTHNK